MEMMMVMAPDGLRKIVHVGHLAGLLGGGEVRRRFLQNSFRSLESGGTFYGVLNAAGPDLSPGPANLTFRRNEATDACRHVDRCCGRHHGDYGNDPHLGAASSP